jgi:hypothetical protein
MTRKGEIDGFIARLSLEAMELLVCGWSLLSMTRLRWPLIDASRRFKIAPPVDPKFGRSTTEKKWDDSGSLRDFALTHGGRDGSIRSHDEMEGSGSAYSLRID